jgi:uncharacterized protein YecE (DUF72 family)
VRRFAYFRWHGSPRLYYSKYSEAQLATFAAAVTKAKVTETWCVFDNTARHAAWDDALQFMAALRRRPVGLAVDGKGGLLIADDTGNSVWRVSAASP